MSGDKDKPSGTFAYGEDLTYDDLMQRVTQTLPAVYREWYGQFAPPGLKPDANKALKIAFFSGVYAEISRSAARGHLTEVDQNRSMLMFQRDLEFAKKYLAKHLYGKEA